MQILSAFFQAQPFAFVLSVFLIGLIIGSFLNVVIHRLPIMMEREWKQQCHDLLEMATEKPPEPFNLLTPNSHCPQCGRPITAMENIPLISYLLQRGRCKGCNAPISPRYPLVELLGGVVAATVAWKFGFTAQALFAIILSWALLALTFIDLDKQLLPDAITLPFLWLGLALSLWGVFVDSHESIIGALAGYLSLWSVYQLFKLLTGKEGMGFGDFKLLAMFGAWFGWSTLPLIIILSSLVGSVVGITLMLFRGRNARIPMAFGPYLAAAGWIAMLWGNELSGAYLQWIAPNHY